jgi:hypothetical protein
LLLIIETSLILFVIENKITLVQRSCQISNSINVRLRPRACCSAKIGNEGIIDLANFLKAVQSKAGKREQVLLQVF